MVEVSKRLQRVTRNYDCLARYGTEEFLILLPEASSEVSHRIAERAVRTICGIPIAAGGQEVKIRASIGVATSLQTDQLTTLLKRAEDDLHRIQLVPVNAPTETANLLYA